MKQTSSRPVYLKPVDLTAQKLLDMGMELGPGDKLVMTNQDGVFKFVIETKHLSVKTITPVVNRMVARLALQPVAPGWMSQSFDETPVVREKRKEHQKEVRAKVKVATSEKEFLKGCLQLILSFKEPEELTKVSTGMQDYMTFEYDGGTAYCIGENPVMFKEGDGNTIYL